MALKSSEQVRNGSSDHPVELMNIPAIHNWQSIAQDFNEGIILGNGASIAFDTRFSYDSLLGQAEQSGKITSDVKQVFDFLKTSDFEQVLRILWHAQNVNQALVINEQKTQQAYANVRDALICAVQSIHVPRQEVADKLTTAAEFLSRFSTVASLNYDLLVYWAMMCANNGLQNRFKDCFVNGEFDSNWERFKKPYGAADSSTLVFYPHGNLVIGADIFGVEKKIQVQNYGQLLDAVIQEWQSEKVIPVFVSEGTNQQKKHSIIRSHYLSTVYEEVLPRLGESVVIYGWSMSDQDNHIVEAICKGAPKRFAVSVFQDPEKSDPNKIDEFCSGVRKKLKDSLNRDPDISFFDSQSDGVWINPQAAEATS